MTRPWLVLTRKRKFLFISLLSLSRRQHLKHAKRIHVNSCRLLLLRRLTIKQEQEKRNSKKSHFIIIAEDRRVTKTREVEGHRTLIVGGGSLYCWSTVSLVCIPPNKTLCFYLRLDKRLNTNQRNRRQKTSCTVIILTTVSVRWFGDSRKDFKVGSVTRWLDYLSYIWPLITIKICL